MEAQSEEECSHIVGFLPPTEAALLDWAINLMADVAQFDHFNCDGFRTKYDQDVGPVMNFLKTLMVKTLREREECLVEAGPVLQGEPSDDDGHHSTSRPRNHVEGNEDEEAEAAKEPPLD